MMMEESKDPEGIASKKEGQIILLESTPKNSPITSDTI
jgi:hypothetical protein